MQRVLRLGIAGLGRAFSLMLPTFQHDTRVQLAAACDHLPAARAQFAKDFTAPVYTSVEALCGDANVEVVYLATPHQFHAAHVQLAAAAGKHILVEKPMALTLQECSQMIDAAKSANVYLIVGYSHSFDGPILRARALIDEGRYGRVHMITAMNYTDFLYRPRRPEELDTRLGGGVIHSQAAHQIDIVRLLAQSRVSTVRAFVGAWDAVRPTEGAYSALLGFSDGSFATAVYSGYGHFDSDSLMDNISEIGRPKDPGAYGSARKRLKTTATSHEESILKAERNYGGSAYQPAPASSTHANHHFGQLIISCDGADLRPTALGIAIDSDEVQSFLEIPSPQVPRGEVIDELYEAVVHGRAPLHDGDWARCTTEVCLAILESARTRRDVQIGHQLPT